MPEEINNTIETVTENIGLENEKIETLVGIGIATLTCIGALSVGKKLVDGAKKGVGKYIEVKDVEPKKETEVEKEK